MTQREEESFLTKWERVIKDTPMCPYWLGVVAGLRAGRTVAGGRISGALTPRQQERTMDKDSFLAGLERAADFHEDQAELMRQAVKAEFPTKYRADSQTAYARFHEEAAQTLRGMKENYEVGKLELPQI
jgi:hypothetical protein